MTLSNSSTPSHGSVASEINLRIHRRLKRIHRINSEKRGGRIGISQIGSCGRQLRYQMEHTKRLAWSDRQTLILEMGTLIHKLFNKLIRNPRLGNPSKNITSHFSVGDIDREFQIQLGTRHTILGHVDAIIHRLCPPCDAHKDSPEKTILEVKSCGDYSWSTSVSGRISKQYLAQINGYMYASGIHNGLFIFVHKSTGKIHLKEVTYDPELITGLIKKLEALYRIQSSEYTKRDFQPNDAGILPFECNYCPYTAQCWKDHKLERISEDPPKYKVQLEKVKRPKIKPGPLFKKQENYYVDFVD